MVSVVFIHLCLIAIAWATLVKQDQLLVYLSIIPSTTGSKTFTLLMVLGCLIVAVLHGMVIYAVYYRKRYFLLPWMLQILIEIGGALAFGSLCCYDYLKCEEPICVENVGCLEDVGCFTFLVNAIIAGVYSIYLGYVEIVAFLFFRHCIKTGDIDMFLEQAAKMATPLVTAQT